jgi:hypothetical protein
LVELDELNGLFVVVKKDFFTPHFPAWVWRFPWFPLFPRKYGTISAEAEEPTVSTPNW